MTNLEKQVLGQADRFDTMAALLVRLTREHAQAKGLTPDLIQKVGNEVWAIAARSSLRMWQPLETIPENVEVLLRVALNDTDGTVVSTVGTYNTGFWSTDDEDGSAWDIKVDDSLQNEFLEVTHWMPKPPTELS